MATLPVPAIASANTVLSLGGPTSPPDYVALGRMGDIKFAGVSVDTVDVSNQQSTAHRLLATLLKTGDLTATFYWEPKETQDQDLFGLIIQAPPVLQQWLVTWPDSSTWAFNGYLTKFTPDASIGKALMAPITISVDDSITPGYPA